MSRFYEFLLVYGYQSPIYLASEKWKHFTQKGYPKMKYWAQQKNTTLLLASFPSADRPFVEQLVNNKLSYGVLEEQTKVDKIPMLSVTAILEDKRELYFSDSCCHYSIEGTKVVSKHLATFIHEHWPTENTQ